MAATVVTLNDFQGHSPVAGLFKCNPSNIYAAFYTALNISGITKARVVKFCVVVGYIKR